MGGPDLVRVFLVAGQHFFGSLGIVRSYDEPNSPAHCEMRPLSPAIVTTEHAFDPERLESSLGDVRLKLAHECANCDEIALCLIRT